MHNNIAFVLISYLFVLDANEMKYIYLSEHGELIMMSSTVQCSVRGSLIQLFDQQSVEENETFRKIYLVAPAACVVALGVDPPLESSYCPLRSCRCLWNVWLLPPYPDCVGRTVDVWCYLLVPSSCKAGKWAYTTDLNRLMVDKK